MLSKSVILYVVQVTDTAFTKVGKGIKVTEKRPLSKAKAKADAKASELAKATPGARFYVIQTISGHMKRPEVCSRSYTAS